MASMPTGSISCQLRGLLSRLSWDNARNIVISVNLGVWCQFQSVGGNQPAKRSVRFGRWLRQGIGWVLHGRDPEHICELSALVRLAKDSEVNEKSFLHNHINE